MNFTFAKQIRDQDLVSHNFDLLIMAISHEERYDYLISNYKVFYNRLAILTYDYNEKLKKRNSDATTTYYSVADTKYLDIMIDLLDTELKLIDKKEEVKILVDYSCMTKTWYYTIMSYFITKDLSNKNIKVVFSYTPSEYISPQNPKYNAVIEPIPGRFRMPSIDKPKALIVGLGYESKKAEGIIEYLDPKITYLMYSKPTLDERFYTAIEKNNQGILERLSNNILTFPVDNLYLIEKMLTTLYNSLHSEYNIVIAPLGPKPFTFVSMLMSMKYEDIDVWRVHSATDFNRYSRKPLPKTELIICEVNYTI